MEYDAEKLDPAIGRRRGQRVDVHRPSAIDPADYEYEREYPPMNASGPLSEWFAQCDHCGARFIYGAWFKHKPSGESILVGHTCSHYLDTSGRAEYLIAKNRTYLRNQAAIAQDAADLAEQFNEHPEVEAFLIRCEVGDLQRLRERNEFIDSLVNRAMGHRPRALSERQLEAVIKFVERQVEWDLRRAEERAREATPTTPVPAGRQTLAGTIRSTKWQDNDFGGNLKMLVVLDDGNKVWGTVPESVHCLAYDHYSNGEHVPAIELRGRRITFTATVEASRNDEHFGFFKRPAKAQLIEEAS